MTQAKESNFISAVVYLRNDAARVEPFLKAVCAQLEEHFAQYELIAVDDCSTDGTAQAVRDFAARTLAKPLTRQTLEMGLHMITALRGKLLQMDRRNRALQEKMTDIRTINRAKWLLIEQLRMTESEAHYYIERQAMDTRLSRREVAENIIRSYDQ